MDVPKASRRMLNEFLDANLTGESQQERLPDVTVEIEEPLLVATVAAIKEQEADSSEKPGRETKVSREAVPAVQTEGDSGVRILTIVAPRSATPAAWARRFIAPGPRFQITAALRI